jgi:SAM-dependent methyltransferase
MLKQGKKTYTFLDLGSGGCDIPIWLIRKCRKKNIHLKVTCLDSDKSIQTYAREITAGYPEITLILGDAFELDQLPDFDYIFSNHFLHHLPDEKITPLIENVARKTKRAFLFNDLYRSPWAYLGYTLAASLFFHKSLAFYDGRLSIRKGFTLKEILQLTEKTRLSCSVQAFKTLPARICILGKNRIKHKESRKY